MDFERKTEQREKKKEEQNRERESQTECEGWRLCG